MPLCSNPSTTLRGLRGYPPLSRGGRTSKGRGKSHFSRNSAHPKSGRRRLLQTHRESPAGRRAHSQCRGDLLFQKLGPAQSWRLLAQCLEPDLRIDLSGSRTRAADRFLRPHVGQVTALARGRARWLAGTHAASTHAHVSYGTLRLCRVHEHRHDLPRLRAPCEKHRVRLRDRVGIEHPLRADVGCRNTLYNAAAQTGAKFFDALWSAGLRHYRVELLEETAGETSKILGAYRALIDGTGEGGALWRKLKASHQLGVTQGTY